MMKKPHLILLSKFTFLIPFALSSAVTHAAVIYSAVDYAPWSDPGYIISDQVFADWTNAAQDYSIETFESLVPAESLLNVSVNGHTFMSGNGTNMTLRDAPTYGLRAHSDSMYLHAGEFPDTVCPLIWLPPEPVYGLGFFGSDLEQGNATITLLFTNDTTQTFSIGGNKNFFWGIIGGPDEAIKQVTITPPGTRDSIGYDDFVVTMTTIPEPTSLILLSLGSVLALRKKVST